MFQAAETDWQVGADDSLFMRFRRGKKKIQEFRKTIKVNLARPQKAI